MHCYLLVNTFARLRDSFNPIQTTDVFHHNLDHVERTEPGPGLSILLLAAGELERALEVRSLAPEELAERRERGDDCYLGLADGRPGHFSWVQKCGRHPISDAGLSVAVEPGEIWIYHCHSAPWCRGRRLYPLTLTAILSQAREEGAHRAWIYTTRDNESSRRGILRAGFVFDHSLRALRLGPRRIRLRAVSAGAALGAVR
jgi:RimJ/RimL family protein N-acetyltransferase